jgi:hypothetical protein
MDRRPERLLDAALPRWDVTERHARTMLALADRVWQALRPVDVDDLTRPLPDGWVRIGLDFRLTPVGRATRLETETRVCAMGPKAKRRFAAYWLVIRPVSGLIRRELLRAVARRAEAAGG